MTDQPPEALVSSVRESFGRLVYSHKTHEKEIEILVRTRTCLRWAEVILIALAAGGAFSVLFGTGFWLQVATAMLATCATAVTLYQLSFDPDHAIHEHRRCARQLWLIREEYVNLLADLADAAMPEATARKRRDELLRELHAVYRDAPYTSARAYAIAHSALKLREEMTFTEDEIDKFLPWPMRRKA
ncbi:MAG: SLATT domain-containing protein [Anaerolineae bacterium]|nr:SLATT domain-containing protein [Anaerolineae bacterium]